MVIPDASKLVSLIKLAAQTIGCRILLQSGWTKYGEENSLLADNVMVIGALPHDWLMPRVAAVVHHGGAGTTAAGLRAGNPTFICPFFGDQHVCAKIPHSDNAVAEIVIHLVLGGDGF
jgi:sterol 3beta-glucosyltransferase